MARIARFRKAIRDLGRGGSAPLTAILERQLEETIVACELARAVAEGSAVPSEAHEQMAEIEHGGDVLRGELVTRLARVLVSPIDREDLFRLSRSIDDVLDNLRDFVREWDLYEIEGGDSFLAILDAIASGVDDLRLAVRTIASDSRDTSQSALVSKKSANEIRRLYDAEVGRLFRGELTMEVLKSRELLRRLDVVGLRLNEAADVLSDAAVKRRA
jgi:uncharacterized protein Yka (UPF0111/DUF47 family)